ncbi:MAG: hypothetical protein K9N00_04565, partial [Candidatus Marinimicrobia bacterium]|nr:hypothetical protein [Candidatus Neomarinimicrobiota bacterium]
FINASLGFSYDLSAPKIESKKKPNKEKIVKVKKTKKVDEKKETKKVEPKIENKEVETDKEKVKAEKVKEKPKMPAKETEPAEKPKKKEPTVEKIQEKVEKEVQPEFHKELKYMIKPHDYLAKIARNLYDDKSKWKNIWEWNDDLVGENPNLIYPYYELHLKNVPAESISKLNYDFYKYEVADNENLRSIALKEYGSPYAWVIIYRDNKDKINLKEGLPAGTILKLRTELYNQE